MTLPTITNFTGRQTKAYKCTLHGVDLYFSYETLVAFRAPNMPLVVSPNNWGTTTGRHINEAIRDSYADPRRAKDRDEFQKLYESIVVKYLVWLKERRPRRVA